MGLNVSVQQTLLERNACHMNNVQSTCCSINNASIHYQNSPGMMLAHERGRLSCHGYTIVTDARELTRHFFAPGPFGAPRAAAHVSLVQRLGLLWPVVLGGGHVELLMAAQGKGGGGETIQSLGLTSPVYFSAGQLELIPARRARSEVMNGALTRGFSCK